MPFLKKLASKLALGAAELNKERALGTVTELKGKVHLPHSKHRIMRAIRTAAFRPMPPCTAPRASPLRLRISHAHPRPHTLGQFLCEDLAYGSLASFFGGLERLVGAPNPQLMAAMAREHCDQVDSEVARDRCARDTPEIHSRERRALSPALRRFPDRIPPDQLLDAHDV